MCTQTVAVNEKGSQDMQVGGMHHTVFTAHAVFFSHSGGKDSYQSRVSARRQILMNLAQRKRRTGKDKEKTKKKRRKEGKKERRKK